jgi:hypothetical protein
VQGPDAIYTDARCILQHSVIYDGHADRFETRSTTFGGIENAPLGENAATRADVCATVRPLLSVPVTVEAGQ